MRSKLPFRFYAIILVLCLLSLGGSVAYYATVQTAHNVISTGGVDIALYELDPTGSESTLIPFSDLERVLPGTVYSKIPYVENLDTEPVWVRANITLSAISFTQESIIIDHPESFMELGTIGSHWTREPDGFFYYNSALATGQATEPLFRTVQFANELTDAYSNAEYFTLTVTAEATQTTENGASALEANWTVTDGEP